MTEVGYIAVDRNGRVLIVPQKIPLGRALLEALPYGDDSAMQNGRRTAATLNWHPQLVEVLHLVVKEWAKCPRAATEGQKLAALRANDMLKLIEGPE